MTILENIYVGVRTGENKYDGTKNRLYLIINQQGYDVVHQRLPKLEDPGSQFVERIDVSGLGLDSARLTDGSVRLITTGSDRWYCYHTAIWGTTGGNFVTPVAYDITASYVLSTDPSDGNFRDRARISQPIPLAKLARNTDQIGLFFLAAEVADTEHAGTTDKIEIKLDVESFDQGEIDHVNTSIPKLNTQRGAQTFDAGFNTSIPGKPLTRDLIRSVTLETDGRDQFTLKSLFLFATAFRNTPNGPVFRLVAPVVHIPDMARMSLSQDQSEGVTRLIVPLCDVAATEPNTFLGGDQVVART